jgi:hypothetical protein
MEASRKTTEENKLRHKNLRVSSPVCSGTVPVSFKEVENSSGKSSFVTAFFGTYHWFSRTPSHFLRGHLNVSRINSISSLYLPNTIPCLFGVRPISIEEIRKFQGRKPLSSRHLPKSVPWFPELRHIFKRTAYGNYTFALSVAEVGVFRSGLAGRADPRTLSKVSVTVRPMSGISEARPPSLKLRRLNKQHLIIF